MSAKSREFYTKVAGVRGDAHLHEPILADGDNHVALNIGREIARAAGLTEAEILLLYAENDSSGPPAGN